jgi:hypothetical protein
MVLILAAGMLALAFTMACGDDDDDEDGGDGDGGAATTVNVTLKEFEITPDRASAPAGDVRFVAKNDGPEDPHELVVVKTDLAPADLPEKEGGGIDEDELEVIGEIEEFDVGKTEEATFDLEPGKYVLLCNIVEEEDGQTESHYVNGMYQAFTVQ